MGFLIDASVLIEAERGRIALESHISGRESELVFLSVITVSELLHGVHRAKSKAIRSKRSAFVEAVLAQFPILTIDLPTARMHARLWADLSAKGQMIGPHDLWLAATCLAHGLVILTGNVREFEQVPDLVVENWMQ